VRTEIQTAGQEDKVKYRVGTRIQIQTEEETEWLREKRKERTRVKGGSYK